MDLGSKFTQSRDVISREVGGEVVLLDLASGTYFGLNAVGIRVWRYLEDQSRSVGEICNMLVTEFDVTRNEAERDVVDLISDLVEHSLLVP